MCQGLQNHHSGEDLQIFPALADAHPELGPVLERLRQERLRQEHQSIGRLIGTLQELIAAEDGDPRTVLAEVDRLVAEVETHLDYEEQQLVPILNAMTIRS